MGQEKFIDVAVDNYLAIEREEDVRYEYHEEALFAMAGGGSLATIPEYVTMLLMNYTHVPEEAKKTCIPLISK